MPQVVVQDTLVAYADTGRGPALLCVHGWMHNQDSFKQLTEALGKKFRIISLDLPNFGASQVNESICSIDDYGRFIGDFANKLKLRDYTLVGHSMGGQIAIHAVSSDLVQPKRLVLIGSAGIRDNRKVYKTFLKLMSGIFRHITPKRLKNRFYNAIGSDYNADLSDVHKKVIKHTLSADVLAAAAAVSVPTLLIYGSKDISTPLAMGEKFAAAITGSKLEVIDGENHWLHQTSADKVASIIKEFIHS